MGVKWFFSWILLFPLLKLMTGFVVSGSVPRKGPLIIASNHTSFLDPPVLGIVVCREVYFLAKPGLFKVSRLFAWLIKTYNALSLEGTKGLRKAIRLMKKGKAVVIFPEGTRSRKGVLLPFQSGVGYLAINFNIPVVPVYIENSNRNFFSLILRLYRLKIKFGKPLYPDGYKKSREDFEDFTEKIRNAILELI